MKLPEDINTPEGRKKWLEGKDILPGCCFCGKGIKKELCQIVITIDKDDKKFIAWQMFWCHKDCMKNIVNKKFKGEFVLGEKK